MTRTRIGSHGSFSGQVIEKITAAETLVNGDSGKVFLLDATGGAYSVTLPTSLKSGVNYRFLIEENTPTGAITIAAGSAIMFGHLAEAEVDTGDDGPGSSGATGVSNIIFGVTSETGDWLEIVAANSKWYISGMTAKDGAVTTS